MRYDPHKPQREDLMATKSTMSKRKPYIGRWQVPAGGKGFKLTDCDPNAKPYGGADKSGGKRRVVDLAKEIDTLQDIFFADRRFKLLVLLQGTDTAGKDGTIRAVFKETSPLGVRTVAWKAPSELERSYDFLWRIHAQVPRSGEIMIHNRSHYEDILVPGVNGWIDAETLAQRFTQINDFERLLSQTGTVIMKFMLHISYDEQRERLQQRIDDPTKHWKFNIGDLDARKQWDSYQQMYDRLLRATSTEWAPWTVVPANSKTHRNLMIATLVRDRLKSLKLRYPPDDAALAGLVVE